MELCDSCNHSYDFTGNNEEGYEKRCYYCSPKQIEGNPQYFIFPDGRVWSNKRKGQFLKPHHGDGYYKVKINNSPMLIHRLIGLHYIPNPDNKPCIDHINRDRLDNRIENLRWATKCENNNNAGNNKKNTSGHKCISYCKTHNKWIFQKGYYNEKRLRKCFKSKIDCICYKYIVLLKLRVLSKNT